ncbi:MAG: DMT family transporter [Haloferacaceae archaeon]
MRYRNLALFLVLAFVWGSAFTAIKAGLAYFPPVLFAAVRYDVAGVLMLAYALVATDRWRPRTRGEWWLVGVGALLMIGGYHALLFVGEQHTTSAAAAVVVGLSPVATTAFARVLLPDERLSAVGGLGMLVGFAGVVVVARPDPANLFGGDALGEWLVFGAALSFALGSVLARRSDADLPIETMEAWSMLGGALAMHAASVAVGERVADVRLVPEALAALAYLAVVASALGFLVYFDLLDRLGPVEINLVSYAAPVAAAVTGFLLLGEVPSAWTGVGFLAVFGGFVLVKRDAVAREVTRLRDARRRT